MPVAASVGGGMRRVKVEAAAAPETRGVGWSASLPGLPGQSRGFVCSLISDNEATMGFFHSRICCRDALP